MGADRRRGAAHPAAGGIDALLAGLASGDESQAEAAAQQIAALGEAGLAGLRSLLRHPDPEVRWWAVRSLAELSSPQAPALLIQALQDPDEGVRWAAAVGLRQQPSSQALPQLAALLAGGDRMAARLSADALISLGSQAVPTLLEIMQNGPQATGLGTQSARLEAARALALIGDPSAIPALFAALDEGSALLEHWASQGLERMGVGMKFFIAD